MNNPSHLPVHAGGCLLTYSTPEEYAAAIKANHALMAVVDKHNEDSRYATEADNINDDQFLWGQDFDTTPEVWELEDWELTQDCFDEGGVFGPYL